MGCDDRRQRGKLQEPPQESLHPHFSQALMPSTPAPSHPLPAFLIRASGEVLACPHFIDGDTRTQRSKDTQLCPQHIQVLCRPAEPAQGQTLLESCSW